MQPFDPLFRNPHAQSIAGHFWPRPRPSYPLEEHLYSTEPGVKVLVVSERPPGPVRGEIVMVHGMEASGQSGYIRSLSHGAVQAGFAAHRFHLRTCGGTERLSATLYHAGLTADLAVVVRDLARQGRGPVYLVGFSLGGNVVFKLAGELGNEAAGLIKGVCGVSAPLDLAACALRIAQPENRIYEARFVRKMRARLCATGRYRMKDLRGLRTMNAIDEAITAPAFGFRDAAHYYHSQSAIRFLAGIRVPALLIQARDDTFIPCEVFERPEVRANPRIELIMTEHGGHLGFLARRRPHLWSDAVVLDWILSRNGTNGSGNSSTV